jgi:protein O-mannosyl-transferase
VKQYLAVVLLLFSICVSYLPAVRNGFVWDDTALILRDPLIRSWRLIPEGFNHYLFVDATPSDFYRPLQRLTYTIEYACFGVRPAAYHITNIALHAVASVVFLFFAEELLAAFGCDARRRRWIALTAALIWALHPVHSGAVDYVSGRADPLAALFGFLGCYLTLRSVGKPSSRAIVPMLGGGVSFLCSALSKETGLVFPVLLLLLLMMMKEKRAAVWVSVAVAFVAVTYLSLRLPAEHNPPPPMGSSAPAAVRPITIARAVAEYAGLLVLPVNLHMERTVDTTFTNSLLTNTSAASGRELQTSAGVCIIVAVLIWAVRTRKRDRLTFALLVSAIITYLPVSGVMRLNASVAEHWLYVPSVFAFLLFAVIVAKNISLLRSRAMFSATTAIFTVWLLFLGTRTFLRAFDWKDQRTFLEHTIAAGGDSPRMLINLAALESTQNHLDLARKYLNQALKKDPDPPFGIIELAAVCIKQNDFPAAHDLLKRATEIPLVTAQAHELLAVLENKEKGRANLLRMRLAAHTEYSNWSIEKRYIKLLAETGATGAAIRELQTCLETQWYRAESWQLLGQLLAKIDQPTAAAEAIACAHSYDVRLSARPTPL